MHVSDAPRPPAYTDAISCQSPRGWRVVSCPHGSLVWVPSRCRRCDGCAELRRRRIARRIRMGLRLLDPSSSTAAMLTLTTRPRTSPRSLMRYWNAMRQWLRRRLPDLEYVAVKEYGSLSGMIHLHVIVTGWVYIHQSELSDAWRRLADGAFRVDIRRLYGPEDLAARYAAKYVAKALGSRYSRKVVTYSRGWPRPESGPSWRLTPWRTSSPDRPNPLVTTAELGGGALLFALADDCSCLMDLDPDETSATVSPEAARIQRRLTLERTRNV